MGGRGEGGGGRGRREEGRGREREGERLYGPCILWSLYKMEGKRFYVYKHQHVWLTLTCSKST